MEFLQYMFCGKACAFFHVFPFFANFALAWQGTESAKRVDTERVPPANAFCCVRPRPAETSNCRQVSQS